jgi:hypothetical protein
VANQALRTNTLYLNGIVVGEVEVTGDSDRDREAALQFLKDNGLHKETTPAQAMFRQALSFATTAAHLHKTDLLRAPRNGFSVAPFVVNSAFSIELYLKTLGQIHNRALKGHELLKLFDSLPTEARQRIDVVMPDCLKEWGPAGGVDLRTCISELNNAFVEWRYCYEKYRTNEIQIDRMIFVMKVLHEACQSAEALR